MSPRLTAAAASPDPRTTLARPDLAEQALEGIVRAAAFRAVRPMHCVVPVIDLHAGPKVGEHPVDQLIFGEAFDVLETRAGRVWGRARRDGVVGWAPQSALQDGAPLTVPSQWFAEPHFFVRVGSGPVQGYATLGLSMPVARGGQPVGVGYGVFTPTSVLLGLGVVFRPQFLKRAEK